MTDWVNPCTSLPEGTQRWLAWLVCSPSFVPPIRLAEIDGQLSALDNRRLIAFGDAGVPVPYRMATANEIAAEAFKFTTTNGGTSIQLRLFSPFRYQGGPR